MPTADRCSDPTLDVAIPLHVALCVDGDVVTVALRGELDVATAPAMAEALAAAGAARRPCVVVDLSQVTFMDSSAIHELLHAQRRLQPQAATLLLRHPRRAVQRVLDLSGASRALLVEP